MRLPEWLIKAGARLEEGKLFFDDRQVSESGLNQLINRGEIPTIYQVRSCERNEAGEITDSSFECGLDLITSKELVWINGAYFDTFREAFRHFLDNEIRSKRYKDFYICDDHWELTRYQECQCHNLYTYDPCTCGYDPNKIAYEPPTIKLLEE